MTLTSRSPVTSSAPRAILHSLLFIVVCAVTLAVIAAPVAKLPASVRLLATGIASAATTYLLCFLFLRWDRLRFRDVGAEVQARSVLRFALGFAGGLLLVILWAGSCAVLGATRWTRAAALSPGHVVFVALAYVALATREELAFRGYPLRRLEHCCGAAVAQIAVAVLFALEHRIGGASWPDALLGVGAGSILFGAAALATRGLAVPIGLHAAWNLGQWALGLKGEPGIWTAVTVKSAASAYQVGLASYLVVTMLGAAAFMVWQRVNRRPRGR